MLIVSETGSISIECAVCGHIVLLEAYEIPGHNVHGFIQEIKDDGWIYTDERALCGNCADKITSEDKALNPKEDRI